MSISEIVADLRARPNGFRSVELESLLTGLGFRLKARKKGGHTTYTHPKLPNFFGASFDRGHGKRPMVKACYIRDVANVLEEYEQVLETILTEKK